MLDNLAVKSHSVCNSRCGSRNWCWPCWQHAWRHTWKLCKLGVFIRFPVQHTNKLVTQQTSACSNGWTNWSVGICFPLHYSDLGFHAWGFDHWDFESILVKCPKTDVALCAHQFGVRNCWTRKGNFHPVSYVYAVQSSCMKRVNIIHIHLHTGHHVQSPNVMSGSKSCSIVLWCYTLLLFNLCRH